jgi:hypothetical protein
MQAERMWVNMDCHGPAALAMTMKKLFILAFFLWH